MPGSFAGESAPATASAPVTKRTRNSSNAPHSERPYAPRVSAESFVDEMTSPPHAAKCGRKPGPLSKSARDAQRRLNHSIIEKARRTKINDALATLRQLVPADYPHKKQNPDDSEEESIDDDDDYEDGAAKKATATNKQKPKGEKEKEFKLEILVRTVAFLQDLLGRVNELEASATPPAVCHNCGNEAGKPYKKRKRSQADVEMLDLAVEDRDPNPGTQSTTPPQSQYYGSPSASSSSPSASSCPRVVPFAHTDRTTFERLPSISSWLSLPDKTEPQLLPAPILNKPLFASRNGNKNNKSNKHNANAATSPSLSSYSYLPSPPSSTHFDPIRTITHPPVLNLGPVAVASAQSPPSPATFSKPVSSSNNPNTTSSTVRTLEDESAASMLLHIATSPLFKPSTITTTSSRSSTAGLPALPDPSNFSLHSHSHSNNERSQRSVGTGTGTRIGLLRQIETPSSILGIRKSP
jgi:hypothetical protein